MARVGRNSPRTRITPLCDQTAGATNRSPGGACDGNPQITGSVGCPVGLPGSGPSWPTRRSTSSSKKICGRVISVADACSACRSLGDTVLQIHRRCASGSRRSRLAVLAPQLFLRLIATYCRCLGWHETQRSGGAHCQRRRSAARTDDRNPGRGAARGCGAQVAVPSFEFIVAVACQCGMRALRLAIAAIQDLRVSWPNSQTIAQRIWKGRGGGSAPIVPHGDHGHWED